MKKMILVIALLSLPLATTLAFHPTKTSCNSCHIMHNSQTGHDVPLWNNAKPANIATYNLYTSDTLNSAPGQPQGSTLLCLSCHDSSGKKTAMNTTPGDLSTSHPMEMIFDSALATADGELKDPSVDTVAINGKEVDGTIADVLLSKGRVNCMSCHDVHKQGLHTDNTNMDDKPAGGYGKYSIPHLQNIVGIEYMGSYHPADEELGYVYSDYSLKYGALCITCHEK